MSSTAPNNPTAHLGAALARAGTPPADDPGTTKDLLAALALALGDPATLPAPPSNPTP